MRNACGSGGGPAWNEILVIYDPPAAPSPRTPREKERQSPNERTNQSAGQRRVYVFNVRGVVRCVMQACVLCARWMDVQ
ncbi:unnamed protein product [Pieris macdunnoughi]|uniref:Uncharacterized protein n=1 Tax=Pieris macdunnoughi TaxID=345717 RepID=A0A821Y9A8_9NEOP|nr:unnamed protein product [Pieris macdunnoughi]